MKQAFLTSVLTVMLPGLAFSAADSYINNDIVNVPPVIDATNFINRGTFSFDTGGIYDFSNVRNFTNEGVMENGFPFFTTPLFGQTTLFSSGFRFDTAPPSQGSRFPAASFVNAAQAGNPATNARIYATAQILISATNIVNEGLLETSESGLVSLQGNYLDLSRGWLKAAPSATSLTFWDSYWGFGTNRITPSANFVESFPNTPIYTVLTYPSYLTNSRSMYFLDVNTQPNGLTTAEFISEFATNRTVQIVFVRNLNPAINVDIRGYAGTPFDLGLPVVRWSTALTNDGGEVLTNSIYLSDTYGNFTTNAYFTNLVKQVYRTLRPQNFTLSAFDPYGFAFGDPGTNFTDKAVDFWGRPLVVSNAQYSAWGALIASSPDVVQTPTQIRGSLGRVEVNGSRNVNLNLARMEAMNYSKIFATNHFAGASNAIIGAPYSDVSLGSSNGFLNVSSLMKPYLDRFTGTIDVYSVVWTNQVFFNGSTNPVLFNVLVVDSALSNRVTTHILDLSLRATNVTVSDPLSVVNALSLNTDWLTIQTNGALNLANTTGIVWRTSVPHLRGLTNYGELVLPNAIYLAGTNSNGSDRPLKSIYNTGTIQGSSVTALATNFFSSGAVYATAGPLILNAVSNLALAEGGITYAALSDISLLGRNLSISNHVISAGRGVTLAITNRLDAGMNDWQVYNGFNMPVRPVAGDLALSTIRSTAIAYQSVSHTWSGLDRGAVTAGYTTNAAVGALVLSGGTNSHFVFAKSGSTSNAIYIDRLELLGTAGQLDASGNLSQVSIGSGMTVYFAQALINGAPAAEFLNGKNNGRLRWISGYAGPMSGTNVVYPDGSTNYLNAALVGSCNIDSDADGTVNCIDPSPIFLPQLAKLTVQVVNSPTPTISLTWPTISGATNRVYDKTNSSGSWRWITNMISPAGTGALTNQYLTPLGKGSRYFKVEVQPRPL